MLRLRHQLHAGTQRLLPSEGVFKSRTVPLTRAAIDAEPPPFEFEPVRLQNIDLHLMRDLRHNAMGPVDLVPVPPGIQRCLGDDFILKKTPQLTKSKESGAGKEANERTDSQPTGKATTRIPSQERTAGLLQASAITFTLGLLLPRH